MSKSKSSLARRGFLKGATAGAAAIVAQTSVAMAQQVGAPAAAAPANPPAAEVSSNQRPGADFMLDVIKSLGIEYCAANPGSRFRGLHESMITYGGNSQPELLKLVVRAPPQGDSGAVAEAARLLMAAQNPVIVAARLARTLKGIDLLVELAELLQARVHDQRKRMNFPSQHPLYARPKYDPLAPNISDADVVLSLEAQELWSLTHRMTPINRFGMESQSTFKPGAKVISISAVELNHKSNYQDFGRYVEADLKITGDAEVTLPALIEQVKRLMTLDRGPSQDSAPRYRHRYRQPQYRLRVHCQGLRPLCRRPHRRSERLGAGLRRALERVKKGEPALLDVVTQPR